MTVAITTIILAIAGFLISLYMTLVYYGRINPNLSLVPTISSDEEQTCRSIVQAPEARVFGIQNSILGMVYYTIMCMAAVVRLVYEKWPFYLILIGLTIVVALFSLYLAYTLIFRLRTSCPFCFTAQAINIALAIILITSA